MVFSNCQTEDIATETNNTHNEISIARKKFSGFQKLPGLTDKVFEDSNLLKRGDSNNPLYDFEIDSTSVTQMEKEGYIYYTMAISRATTTEESFENLVVSDDAQQAYIFKYYPSAEYLQNKTLMAHPQYSGGLRIIPINYSQIFNRQNCVGVTFSFCTNPGGGAAGPGCYDNEDGGAHVVTISYEVCSADDDFLNLTQIIADPAPGSSNGGGGAGGGGGGSPTPGSYPAGLPSIPIPSDPNSPLSPVTGPSENPVLTEPVMLSNSIRLFVRDLDVLQKAWWNNSANAVAVGIITEYLNDNSTGVGFAEEAINALMDGGEVDFENRIIDRITINMPCQKQIIKDILAVSSPFTNVIKQTFNSSDNVNIRLQNGNFGAGNATTDPPTLNEVNSGSYIIDILYDNSYLQNASDLSIVATTLHELVHAYLITLYFKGDLICENPSYGNLLTAFINFYQDNDQVTFDEYDNQQHNAMADFMNKMANSIYNYAQLKNIHVTPEYCYKLACGTNTGTASFANTYNTTQQLEYNNIYTHEQNGDTQAQGTPCN